MEQQDHLERQIEQFGRILGRIFSGLIGLRSQGKINEGIEITSRALKSELDLDIQKLLTMPLYGFVNTLKKEKGFSNENLDKLAGILQIIADNTQGSDKKNLYEKCLAIYEQLEKTENVYSIDQQWKIEQIKNNLRTG